MGINKRLWLPHLYALGGWACPSCWQGLLNEVRDTRSISHTADTKRFIEEVGYEHSAWRSVSSSKLQCNNASCEETAIAICDVRYTEFIDQDTGEDFVAQLLTPIFVHPAPPIIRVADSVPDNVASTFREAFALYWPNPSASGNALRRAIELIMDEQGIERFPGGDENKRQLTLHARIERFEEKAQQPARLLMAIKWLGNAASHGDAALLSHEDVLDGFEFAEAAIDIIYVQTLHKLILRAEEVNAQRGPLARSADA